jgi:hypothetical protein
LYDAALTDADIRSLRFPRTLRWLRLSSCRLLTNESVDWIVQESPQLERLELDSCPLIDDGAVEALARLRNCKTIDVRRTAIGFDTCAHLAQRLGDDCGVISARGEHRGERPVDPVWYLQPPWRRLHLSNAYDGPP